MASDPVFIGVPKTWMAAISIANANRDGTGTIVNVVTAGANGSRVDKVRIVATGAVTAGVVRLFLHDGTHTRLLREIMVSATTPSELVETFTQDVDFADGSALPNGWSLQAATHNAEGFNVISFGGDF